jgi:tetratricopeptide (TPR) repeat protein
MTMQVRFTRLAALVVVLSATLVAGCGKYSISNIRSAKAFQDANAMYAHNDWAGAQVRYEDSVRFNPDLGFAYFFLGHSHQQQYRPTKKDDPANAAHLEEAAKNYRIAIDKLKDTQDPQEQKVRRYAFEYLIDVYGADKLNDFSKAEPAARELIAADPGDPSTYRILAKLYEDQGRMDDAEKELLRGIDAKPNDPVGYQMLAGFYEKQGDFEKTIDAWIKRAAIEPKNPESWHTIGAYYQKKVFTDHRLPRNEALDLTLKGLEAEDKALAISPDYYEAVSYKNILLKQQALYEKDPAKQKKLLDESEIYYKKAMELRDKQAGELGKGKGKDGK